MKSSVIGIILLIALFAGWGLGLWVAPTDIHMGEVYRIIYLHVPVAFTAFLSSFILFVISIKGLIKGNESSILWGRACAEVGLIFTALTLASGSIWGYPTWGTWWTWDPRLTTTFLLALMYTGYLLLANSMAAGPQRIKATAILGILIFADVPIIYKSVNWWRTLHQPQTIMRPGGSSMSWDMLWILLLNTGLLMAVGGWLIYESFKNKRLKEELEEASYKQMQTSN